MQQLSAEKLSYYLTRMVYRDTALIEDAHAQRSRMDAALYQQAYQTLTEKLAWVERNQQLLAGLHTEADFLKLRRQKTAQQMAELRGYVSAWHLYTLSRSEWDPPERQPLTDRPDDAAAYLLEGRFRQGCEQGDVLSDAVMYALNKDIYNRMYTLVCLRLPENPG